MSTTADFLASDEGGDFFYVLRITGIDVWFCSVIDPTDPKYGTSAYSFSTTTVVPGMMLPKSSLNQSLPDVIGGVATAERITVELTDFQYTNPVTGLSYPFLGRLFSPGVAVNQGTVYELASDIPAYAGAGAAVKLRISWTGVVPPTGYYAVGGETIQMGFFSSPDANGLCTGSIQARNVFPCSTVFPPIPTHRIVKNEVQTNALGRNILVTPFDTPFTMLGRTAALYVGHMVGGIDGVPCLQSELMLRTVGRIRSFSPYSANNGSFSIEIESVVADLAGAKAATGLGSARILPDQIVLPLVTGPTGTSDFWRRIQIGVGSADGSSRTSALFAIDATGITDSIYTIPDILSRINANLAATHVGYLNSPQVAIRNVDGTDRVFFSVYDDRTLDRGDSRAYSIGPSGLMWALGFEGASTEFLYFSKDDEQGRTGLTHMTLVATKPVASVFLPAAVYTAMSVKFAIRGLDGSSSQYFFTDQANGQAGIAYVQFGDGAVVKIESYTSDAGGDWLTTSNRQDLQFQPSAAAIASRDPAGNMPGEALAPYYYVTKSDVATVKQVIVSGNENDDVDPGIFVSQLLASYSFGYTIDDTNYFSEGVGLSWRGIMDVDSFLLISAMGTNYPRIAVIDSDTKLMDIIGPILKEYGAAIVWDPSTALVTMRTLRIPGPAGANAVVFSDSNKATVSDITTSTSDTTNIRTGWTLKWGWDITQKQFTSVTPTIIDNAVLSAGVVEKTETIEDKTLAAGPALDGLLFLSEMIFVRSDVYRQEWRRCRRTMSRVGMTLAPGSFHQVIDVVYDEVDGVTIIGGMTNPFTGMPGITAADQVYALLMSVEANLATGSCTIEYLMSRQGLSSQSHAWAPTGLVDYNATGRGYDNATGIVTMARRYSSSVANKDGDAFRVGDIVRLTSWDNSSTATLYLTGFGTVTAVATDGSTMTIDAGLGAIPVGVEAIVILTNYASQSTARRAEVTFQGNAATGIIGTIPGARNNKWG